jgi:hypothetical protein
MFCNGQQIVVAAEVSVSSADFGQMGPMIDKARTELAAAGITQGPGVVLADAGYWQGEQIDRLMGKGVQVLNPPDAGKRRGIRPGWDGGRYAFMATSSTPRPPATSMPSASGRSSRSSPTPSSTAASTLLTSRPTRAARLAAASACRARLVRVRVVGRQMWEITFAINGRHVRTITVRAGQRSVTVSLPMRNRRASQRVTARVRFRNGARARTLGT